MMWSEVAMLALQIFCGSEAALRGSWWKALYWAGAAILTVAIVRGMKS